MAVRPAGGRVSRTKLSTRTPMGARLAPIASGGRVPAGLPVFAGVPATFDTMDAWAGSGTLSGTPSGHTVM